LKYAYSYAKEEGKFEKYFSEKGADEL